MPQVLFTVFSNLSSEHTDECVPLGIAAWNGSPNAFTPHGLALSSHVILVVRWCHLNGGLNYGMQILAAGTPGSHRLSSSFLRVLYAVERDGELPDVFLLWLEQVDQFNLFDHVVVDCRERKMNIPLTGSIL